MKKVPKNAVNDGKVYRMFTCKIVNVDNRLKLIILGLSEKLRLPGTWCIELKTTESTRNSRGNHFDNKGMLHISETSKTNVCM